MSKPGAVALILVVLALACSEAVDPAEQERRRAHFEEVAEKWAADLGLPNPSARCKLVGAVVRRHCTLAYGDAPIILPLVCSIEGDCLIVTD